MYGRSSYSSDNEQCPVALLFELNTKKQFLPTDRKALGCFCCPITQTLAFSFEQSVQAI